MLGVQGASHDVGFWGLEGGGERPAPKLVLGYVCVPLRFLWCVRGVLRKCQGSLLGWEPALSCKVLGAPPGHGWAAQPGPCPGFPFMATSASRVHAATVPASMEQGTSSSYGKEMLQMHCSPPASLLCACALAAARHQLALLTAGAAGGTEVVVLAKTSEPVEAGMRIQGWFFPLMSVLPAEESFCSFFMH